MSLGNPHFSSQHSLSQEQWFSCGWGRRLERQVGFNQGLYDVFLFLGTTGVLDQIFFFFFLRPKQYELLLKC